MPSDPERPDVIVVGAGPVGLSVALGLARAGRGVLVLEKEPATVEHSRAPAIWPRTQELLDGLGVLDSFVAEGTTLEHVRLRNAETGREMLSIPLSELEGETPFPRLLILPQSVTERLLAEALDLHAGARVRFAAEVVGIEQSDSGVSVTWMEDSERRTVEGAFAVGCDGAHSTVRAQLGSTFDGETYDVGAALADIRPHEAEDVPFPRISTRSGVAVAIRMDESVWRLILPFAASEERPLDERVEAAAARLFPGVRSAEGYVTVWQSEFRLHRRIASPWVRGRVALAGDAAHLNSPVGGQGMNAGIQDGAVLTEALLRALDRGDGGSLAEYELERRPVVEHGVNVFTDRLTRLLLFGDGRAIGPVLRLARLALRVPPLRRRFLRRIAMLESG